MRFIGTRRAGLIGAARGGGLRCIQHGFAALQFGFSIDCELKVGDEPTDRSEFRADFFERLKTMRMRAGGNEERLAHGGEAPDGLGRGCDLFDGRLGNTAEPFRKALLGLGREFGGGEERGGERGFGFLVLGVGHCIMGFWFWVVGVGCGVHCRGSFSAEAQRELN